MLKRFYQLKRGEQFTDGGWDFMKIGLFTARSAHSRLKKALIWPWEFVKTIPPNPNCDKECPCKKF